MMIKNKFRRFLNWNMSSLNYNMYFCSWYFKMECWN